MNYLDIALLVILAIGLFIGLGRGLVKTVFGLAGLILGVVLAGQFYKAFSDSTLGQIITFILIFIFVVWLATIAGALVRKVVKLVMLGWVDGLGGALFGVAMAGIILGVALVAYLNFFGSNSLISDSVVSAILVDKLPLVLELLPGEFGDTVRPFFH